ncbi:hypothetical protein [Cellulosimicrobium cellulans]|uniref:hypothetical protein n=1 Tax=Cellulosimicrobium cellulans TaxID=1710 RepID=UPI00084884A8|nr:hypothetical protein [Cellulosimicrobium cellulans]
MDDTNPDDADVSRLEPQPGAHLGSAERSVRRVDPGLATVHGLWIGALTGAAVLAAVGALLGPGPGVGERLATAVALSAWLGLVWVPITALWGCIAGYVGGLAARLTARVLVSVPAAPVLVGAVAGAAVGWAGTFVVDVGLTPTSVAAVVGAGALVGAVAVALERRGGRRAAQGGRPRHRGALTAGTAVLAAVAWLWTGWVSLQAEPLWDVDETCGPLLGFPSGEIGFASGGFPLQGWCLGGTSEVVPTQPVWHAVLATVLLTAAGVATVVLLARRLGAWRSRAGRAVAGAVLAVAVGAGAVWAWAAATAGPSDVDWQELARQRDAADAQEYAQQAPPPVSSGAGPSPAAPEPAPSAPAPAVSGAAARADLDALRVTAQDAGGPDLLWPEPLAVVDAPCTAADGTAGAQPSLTGRFTTRDLATATDNLDFLSITQANEDVAERIVQAWSQDGLGTPEPLHGEWWQSPTPDGRTTVEIAHVGFEEGVGVVQVDAACATRP